MNKHFYMSQMKSRGTAYACWFFLGVHYAYMGKWGTQIMFWCTFGGLGFWWLLDLFRVGSVVDKHNLKLSLKIEELEKQEKKEDREHQMAMMSAAKA